MLARWPRRLPCRLTVQLPIGASLPKTISYQTFLLILCSKLFSFFLTDVKISEYPPKFSFARQIVIAATSISLYQELQGFPMHRIIAVIHRNSRGRLVFEIVGLASGTTFVGTIEEGWNSHQTAVQHDNRQTTKALHQGKSHEPGISSLGHSNSWIFQHDFGMFQGDDSSL